jgi:hypothetical protein
LPNSVVLHFHGHAHIGDEKFVGSKRFRKITWMDDHDIPQIDVASLDNRRGSQVRSAFLELYKDGSYGVLFRNHETRHWRDTYYLYNPDLTGGDPKALP